MKIGQLHVKVVLAMILTEYEVHQKPENKPELDNRSAANGINLEFKKITVD